MSTMISFIIVLGVLIFIHELGHFAVAKWSGVGVEKFSLGFGPRIFSYTYGETEYRIGILPLGGYVKMVGEEGDSDVSPEDMERSFNSKGLMPRAAIIAAGSVMNLLLAFVLMPVIFMIGVEVSKYLDEAPRIGFIPEGDSAYEAGLRTGDLIERVNGAPVESWERLMEIFLLSPERDLQVEALRDGSPVRAVIVPEANEATGTGLVGIYPPMDPIIGSITKGYPAEEAGIRVNDRILEINGTEITHWAQLDGLIKNGGQNGEMNFLIGREGREISIPITPKLKEEHNVYLIGVNRLEETVFKKYGPVEATVKGVTGIFEMGERLFKVIGGLLIGDYSVKTLGGPILIAQVAGQAAESGLVDLLSLIAFLSLQLGIINLFPIPVLDGGHLVFLAIEAIRGRPLPEKVLGGLQQVGVVMLIALMVLVTYNDIFRLFS